MGRNFSAMIMITITLFSTIAFFMWSSNKEKQVEINEVHLMRLTMNEIAQNIKNREQQQDDFIVRVDKIFNNINKKEEGLTNRLIEMMQNFHKLIEQNNEQNVATNLPQKNNIWQNNNVNNEKNYGKNNVNENSNFVNGFKNYVNFFDNNDEKYEENGGKKAEISSDFRKLIRELEDIIDQRSIHLQNDLLLVLQSFLDTNFIDQKQSQNQNQNQIDDQLTEILSLLDLLISNNNLNNNKNNINDNNNKYNFHNNKNNNLNDNKNKEEKEEEKHYLSVIVPIKGEMGNNLEEIFCRYISSFLLDQLPSADHFEIIFSEQIDELEFNRAYAINIGSIFASNKSDYFAIHDVDLFPFKDTKYSFPIGHSVVRLTKQLCNYHVFRECEIDPIYFNLAGVAMITKELWVDINGMSNSFWGWGGEGLLSLPLLILFLFFYFPTFPLLFFLFNI